MSKPSYICNCDVIHEDIVNDVNYLEMVPEYKSYALEIRVRCVCDLCAERGNEIAISHS